MWSNNEWMFYLQVLMWLLFVSCVIAGTAGLGWIWVMLRAYLVEKKMRNE